MKKITLTLAILMLTFAIKAQAPNAFNYQVVVRNNSGQVIANQNVGFRFTIREGSGSGTIIYRETQSKTTNSLGLISTSIGSGIVVSGTWPTATQLASGDKYFQIEMDANGGTSYLDMGATQILAVPYANFANNTANANNANYANTAGTANTANFATKADNAKTADSAFKANTAQNALNYGGKVNPNQIIAAGATIGQILKWNGTNWVPGTDDNTTLTGGTGVSIGAGKINTPWTQTGNDLANNNTGNIGIGGPASSTAKLNVQSDGSLTGGLKISGPSSGSTVGSALYLDGQNQDYTITATNAGSGSGANRLVFRNYSAAKDIMTLTANNNVGIGTTAPNARFHLDATDLTGAEAARFGLGNKTFMSFYQKNNSIGLLGNWSDSTSLDFGTNGSGTKVNLVTGGTPRLTVEGSNVGIGTTSPTYLLDVVNNTSNSVIRSKSAVNNTNSTLILENNASLGFTINKGGSNTGASLWGWNTSNAAYLNNTSGGSMFFATNDSMGFLLNNSEKMRISALGNVGIGEKNPTYKLHVTHGGSSGMLLKSTASYSILDIDAFSGDAALRFLSNGVSSWNVRNQPGTDNFQIFEMGGGGERLLIQNSTGNVGINQFEPAVKLHVVAPSTAKGAAIFENSIANSLDTGIVATFSSYTGSSNLYHFTANSAATKATGFVARVKYMGVEGLVSSGSTTGYGGYFSSGNSNQTNYGVSGIAAGSSGINYGVYGSAGFGTTNYAIYCAGNGVYTGTWSSSSDARLKTDIQNLNQGLDVVMKLRPTSYLYRTNDSKYKTMALPVGTHFGFIAQELENVLPSLVSNNVHQTPSGSTGSQSEAIDFKAVNYTELIPILTKAIQEQQAQIELLKQEVSKLKGAN